MSKKEVIQSWDWDVRVRERNIKRGLLDAEIVEKQMAKLADNAEQTEAVTLAQPALGGRPD